MGIPFAAVEFKGKLYAETLEGGICVKADDAKLEILNPVGEVIAEMAGEKCGDEIRFALDGSVPGSSTGSFSDKRSDEVTVHT